VDSFWRVFPFVWPHRHKVLLSSLFACLVALFWGVNLSVAYPVVKVLLQGQGAGEYVETEIAAAQAEADKKTENIANLDRQLAEIEGRHDAEAAKQRVRILVEGERHSPIARGSI
jgi:subfamily B ATP-binding cassette protein MsbA